MSRKMLTFRCKQCNILIKDVKNRKTSIERIDPITSNPKYWKADEKGIYFCRAECSSKYMEKYYENSVYF